MMTDNPTFEKIEAWLSGELSEADARLLEAEIAANPELAAAVERHRRGRIALDRLVEQDLRADFANWRETLDRLPSPPPDTTLTENTTPNGLPDWQAGLAGLALVAVVGGAIWYFSRPHTAAPDSTVPAGQVPPGVSGPVAETPSQTTITPVGKNQPATAAPGTASRQLIALADTRLASLPGYILTQLDENRGTPNEAASVGPDFADGQKAFQKGDYAKAQGALLRVTSDHEMFPYTQEMLAWIDFRNKNYPGAAAHYETYAGYDTGALAQWRLTLFYLADYEHQQAKFWNSLEGVIAPANGSAYRNAAMALRSELRKQGLTQ